MSTTLSDLLSGYDVEQRTNLGSLLDLDGSECTTERLITEMTWLYRSRLRESLKSNAGTVKQIFSNRFLGSEINEEPRDIVPPTYEELIVGLAKNLKVYDESAELEIIELYVSHAVVVDALKKMKPHQRVKFFEERVDMGIATSFGNHAEGRLSGPIRTISALGVVNAGGFSVFAASSTALGFVTHAVGTTLPFAVYTGMSQTIAFLIGPVGWLAAGSWLAFGLTEPSWKKLLPVVMFLITNQAIKRIENSDG